MKSTLTTGLPAAAKKTARPATGIRWIEVVLVLLAIGGGAAWFFLIRPAQSSALTPSSSITTATVVRGTISLTASGSGTLMADQAVNMSFSTSGKVAELNVKPGDMVKTGDVLARLEKADDLEANLASAQVTLLDAQQSLAKLQKKAGSSLAQAYQSLVTAQKTYADAVAADQRSTAVRCSQDVLAKYKTALTQATEWLYEVYVQAPDSEAYATAHNDYDTALASYTYCLAYTPVEKTSAASDLAVAKAAVDEAQKTYNTLKASSGVDPDTLLAYETKVATAQTMVQDAQAKLDGITLIAPIDGKITSVAASVGAIVDTSTFLTISDLSQPTVTVSVDATDTEKLVVGNAAEVTFSALPGKTFTGKVSMVSPEMQSFGPFKVAFGEVKLDEASVKTMQTVPLGASATIKVTGSVAKNVLVVPVGALTTLKNGDVSVTLVSSDGLETEQIVTVGLKDSSNAEITSGLKEGDTVKVKTSSTSSSGSSQGGFPGGGFPPD
jgi:RND family efflux transporter MFP subunit